MSRQSGKAEVGFIALEITISYIHAKVSLIQRIISGRIGVENPGLDQASEPLGVRASSQAGGSVSLIAAPLTSLRPFEMVDMCKAAGFEPIITTTAQATDCCDPSDMADLVEYVAALTQNFNCCLKVLLWQCIHHMGKGISAL